MCAKQNTFNKIKEKYSGLTEEFMYDFNVHSKPHSILLGLTNDCNLACPYCFVKQDKQAMSYEIAEQSVKWVLNNIIDKENIDKPTVIFFGGEPLLMFDEIIVPLVENYGNKVNFSITTNGVLLDEDKVDFFYKNNVDILLSFDGLKVIQNKQRPGKEIDSYNTIIKNIPYYILRYPNATMRMTLTKDSIPYLFDTVIFAEELGFNKIVFVPNAYEQWGIEEEKEYDVQLQKIGLHIYKSFFNNKQPIRVAPIIETFNKIHLSLFNGLKFNNNIMRCGLGTTSCAITPNGDIIPCQEKISNPITTIGNTYTGIDAIKHKQYLETYITAINNIKCNNKNYSIKECLHCLSTLCPSRLEDLRFELSSSICCYNRILLKNTNRLFMLCYENINPFMQSYFDVNNIIESEDKVNEST